MSPLLSGVLIIAITAIVTVVVHLFVSRRVSVAVLKEHNEVAASFLHVTGGIYGIMLAFVVSLVWEDNEQARRTVAEEANSAATMVRLAQGLPAPAGPRLRADSLGYIRDVIDDEWSLMAKGRSSEVVNQHVIDLWRTVTTFEPQTEGQKAVHAEILSDMRRLADERRSRLFDAEQRLPTLVWGMIVFGGAIVLALANVFGLRFIRSKGLMTLGLALSVAVIVVAINSLAHPFAGSAGITPVDFQRALAVLQDHPAVAAHP